MGDKIIKPERRRYGHRQDRLAALGQAVDKSVWSERRTHCWDLEPDCSDTRRRKCSAHFVRRNCWDLWAAEYFPPGRKPCCHPESDCAECAVALAKFGGPISVHVQVPGRLAARRIAASNNGRVSQVCPSLYSVKETAEARGDGDGRVNFRCQWRRGISLHSSYVSEVCGTIDHPQCPFFQEE